MTPSELAVTAGDAIRRGVKSFPIVLSRRASRGRSFTRRVVVFNRPRLYGEVATETSDGRAVVYVEAIQILAWLAAAGLIQVDAELSPPTLTVSADASCADQPAAPKTESVQNAK